MSKAALAPLERTAIMNKTDIVDEIAEEVGVDQSTSRHLTKDTISEVCGRLGVQTAMHKRRMIVHLRQSHPELDASNSARDMSWAELRELHASLCRNEEVA